MRPEQRDEIWRATLEAEAALARGSLTDWMEMESPHLPVAAHHRILAEKLEDVDAGRCHRLIVTMPPQNGKSTRVRQGVSWMLGRKPDRRFLHVGYAQKVIDGILALVPKGIITHPSQVGGYPDYKGTPYKDSDGDGMPDVWEYRHHLDVRDAQDAGANPDGDSLTTRSPRPSLSSVTAQRHGQPPSGGHGRPARSSALASPTVSVRPSQRHTPAHSRPVAPRQT